MDGYNVWKYINRIVWIISVFCSFECAPDVFYAGKLYVSEGEPFNISCVRSAYGSTKWYKNGLIIDPGNSEFIATEQNISLTMVLMELRVQKAFWSHRGEYKCDALNENAHRIEVIPSMETDQNLRISEKGRQRKMQLAAGETMIIPCEKEEHDAFPINWYKDGRRLQEVEDKIKMQGRNLTIYRADELDTGDYVCIFEEKGQSYLYADHQGSRTWVTHGARVTDFSPQIRPILNRNLTLECKVQGFPIPRISWFVDGIELKYYMENESRYDALENDDGLTDAVFFISNVTSDDNHIVMCAADNVEGFDNTVTELAVRDNTIYTNEDYPGSGLILTPGTELTLACNFSDDPSARFQWYKNDEPFETSSDPRIHLEEPRNVLKIEKAIEKDCGNYSCVSNNIRATIAVRSMVKLGPFENSRNVVQGQSITLACNVTQGFPLPTLKWYKDDQELNVSDPRITVTTDIRMIEGAGLIIADANFEDRAEYTCNATNEISSANATILVRVKDKYAALWPFLGICAEVAVLCTIIFIYEKRRQKPDFDEAENEQNTENKSVPDQEDKSRDVRQRK